MLNNQYALAMAVPEIKNVTPTLSILIPAFNAAEYLDAALNRLVVEAPAGTEIIVCDDGSTDATGEIVTRHAMRHPWIRLIRQPNTGAAAARNAAFRASTGVWVYFFDADDLCGPGTLEAMLRLAKRHPTAVIHCAWSKFVNDPAAATAGPLLAAEPMAGWRWLRLAFERDYPTYLGCFLVPRSLVDKQGLWDEQLGFQDDMEFFARILAGAPEVRFCKDARFLYRAGVPGSLSKQGGRRSSESQLLATELAVQHLLAADHGDRTRAAAARQLMLVAYAQHVWAPDIGARAEAAALELAPSHWCPPRLPGGPLRKRLQVLLGWKLALHVHARLSRWCR